MLTRRRSGGKVCGEVGLAAGGTDDRFLSSVDSAQRDRPGSAAPIFVGQIVNLRPIRGALWARPFARLHGSSDCGDSAFVQPILTAAAFEAALFAWQSLSFRPKRRSLQDRPRSRVKPRIPQAPREPRAYRSGSENRYDVKLSRSTCDIGYGGMLVPGDSFCGSAKWS
jgi:hypothetical protein